jgi:hypothetical protein
VITSALNLLIHPTCAHCQQIRYADAAQTTQSRRQKNIKPLSCIRKGNNKLKLLAHKD